VSRSRSIKPTARASSIVRRGPRSSLRALAPFRPHERRSIDFFVQMADVLGVQKSVAEIYGFLYVCSAPISFPEIEKRLTLSKGSVSEGLRFLKDHGMVESTRVKGVRADLWSVTPSLAGSLANLLRSRLQPALESASPDLRKMKDEATQAEVSPAVIERIARLSHWNDRALELLPLLLIRPPTS